MAAPRNNDTGSAHDRMARLRATFRAQLPARIAAARAELDAVAAPLKNGAGSADDAALGRLELALHTLKGGTGTFGLTALHDLIGEADQLAKQAMAGTRAVDGALIAALNALFDRIQQADLDPVASAERFSFDALPAATATGSAVPAVSGAGAGASAQTRADADAPVARAAAVVDSAAPAPTNQPGAARNAARRARRVYVCDDDGATVAQLATQLGCFGYTTAAFDSLADLTAAIRADPPDALVMDVMFPEGAEAGPARLAALNAELGQRVPTIYISCRDDFAARLHAVKAGGSAYVTKPVRTTAIVEFLDTLTNHDAPIPYHILIVDDDPEVAAVHALILEQAGMTTAVATDPATVPALLKTFVADLVLMDMYMPGCSGPELASVLRQMSGHVSLPIIYLSSETDRDRQLQALEVGADGFMTKPADPGRLVTEVRLRAERMRILRALMVRDGLTGLFNHNAILQFLEHAIASARREQRPLSVAMIDVDRFKLVNDTYGHPAGDQVLMALSRGLRLRLRECDLVGRYGGEEFVAVLVGADEATAKDLVDQLRVSFSGVLFYAGDEHFTCTFSAGVAALPPHTAADVLIQAADAALYRAKNGGRNQVMRASAVALDADGPR